MLPTTLGTILLVCLVVVVEIRVHIRETASRRRSTIVAHEKPRVAR